MPLLVKPHDLVNSRRFAMRRIIDTWLAANLKKIDPEAAKKAGIP
jgi:hypothetical protein